MEIGTSAVLNDIHTDRINARVQNRYIENLYTETLLELYNRSNHRLTQAIQTRLNSNKFLAEVKAHFIWSPLLARCLKNKRRPSVPWLLFLSRETSKYMRRNQKRSGKKRYRIPEAATIVDFMLNHFSENEGKVFRSYYLDGGDYLEIARVTELPPLQVSQLLANAHNTLQNKFHPSVSPPVALKGVVRMLGIKGILAAL